MTCEWILQVLIVPHKLNIKTHANKKKSILNNLKESKNNIILNTMLINKKLLAET